ncbi:MAG: metal-dependent hydrolase [Campylobacterota bacterium]|nr:metal-dependent hydrolase [Campylobacterota bacterium]
MKIITADYIYIDGKYKKDYAVAFEQKIVAVAPYTQIIEQYPDAIQIEQVSHSVLYPGFINTHVHLEFSANRTTLRYGSYAPWLYSVIEDRNHLVEICNTEMMKRACEDMLESGVTTFGAISNMGLDLDACMAASQRVIFFNELVGSNPQSVDALYADFIQRFEASASCTEGKITPAIAIHSPYAVHPIVLKKAITFAKEREVLLSAHFLESQAEREWLDHSSGEFKPLFESLFNQSRSTTTVDDFLSKFDGYPTHFTHCVHAKERELQKISQERHTIAHCPRSNRLLGCGRLEIERLEELDIPFSIATDGLSSNNSLNIFDELRAALMIHDRLDLHKLSNQLIDSVTSVAAGILRVDCGQITEGYSADFTLIQLPESPKIEEDIALWTILHTKRASAVYIGGERFR